MDIHIDDDSIMAFESLSGFVKEEVGDFLYAVGAAKNIEALLSFYPEATVADNTLTWLVKPNEQFVTASVIADEVQTGKAFISIKSYD